MASIQYTPNQSHTIATDLRKALGYQHAGDLHRAWTVYRDLLARFPEQADALNLMGTVAADLGDLPQAIALLERAVRSDNRIAGFQLNLANARVRAGDRAGALTAFRKVLELDPMHAAAHRGLGLLLLQMGAESEAWDHLMRAARFDARAEMSLSIVDGLLAQQRIDLAVGAAHAFVQSRPADATLHYCLGNALVSAGNWHEAGAAYRQALILRPDFPEAQCNLARVLRRDGDDAGALALYRQAIATNPQLAEAHLSLGVMLREHGDLAGARAAYEQAAAVRPDWALAHFNLANLYRDSGLLDAALERYQRCLQLDPNMVYGWVNQGNAQRARKQLDRALQSYRRALALDAGCVEAQLNIGNVQRDLDHLEQAVEAYAAAIELRPGYAEAFNNLGCALREQGRIDAARAACQQATLLRPDYPDAHYNLGATFVDEGLCGTSLTHVRRSLELNPGLLEAHANLLMTSHYVVQDDPAAVLATHREFDRAHAAGLTPVPPRSRARRERLRVAYLSSDFRRHSVAYFAEPVLAHHDPERFEVVCYHNEIREDTVTARFKGYAAQWIPCAGMNDEELAQHIADEDIDVLVDLNGFTEGHRLLTVARRPARVHMTWLGYPGSSGLSAMDYRFTDWQVDPAGYEAHNSEQPLRLPDSLFCYRPPADAPEVAVAPVTTNGYITFGSFNNLAKLSDACVTLWSRVLQSVPDARLLLKTKVFADEGVRARTLARFAAAGVDPTRIELTGWEDQLGHHLATYHRVDIALDTWPYNGATTTCEALWMGVPVVSLCGPMHASRVGFSILKTVGRGALVERDAEGFVARATDLARDRAQLARGRETLRQRLRLSPLMDELAYARHFEASLLRAWRQRVGA